MQTAWVYVQDADSGRVDRTTCSAFWPEKIRLERKHGESLFLAQARERLKNDLWDAGMTVDGKRSVTVYAIVRSVSHSGMSRAVDLYLTQQYGIQRITGLVANAAQMKLNKHEELVLRGCGTDTVWDLVDELWQAMRLAELSMTFNTRIL